MSFSIDAILKPDRKKRKNSGSETVRHVHHFHYDVDDYGSVRSYRGEHSKNHDAEDFIKSDPEELLEDDTHESTSTSTEVKTHRKRRILFTREQTYELQKVFQYQQYLTVPQRDYLSRKINLTPTQVKIWFQNHRYKLKKYVKECHSAKTSKPKTSSSYRESKSPSSSTSGYNDRPTFLMERLSPLSRSELRTYRSQSPPERPTMYPFRKPYSRTCSSSPDRLSSYRSLRYPAASSSLGCCECEKYAPPTLVKWKRCESEPSTPAIGEKD